MQGLLADVNVQGHLAHLRRRLEALQLWDILDGVNIRLVSFPDLQLDPSLDDRSLWNLCQQEGWVLFTENRNDEGSDSLHTTHNDSWRNGLLPVLTLASKKRFEDELDYADAVAKEVADILFGLKAHEFRDQPRIYVPRQWP